MSTEFSLSRCSACSRCSALCSAISRPFRGFQYVVLELSYISRVSPDSRGIQWHFWVPGACLSTPSAKSPLMFMLGDRTWTTTTRASGQAMLDAGQSIQPLQQGRVVGVSQRLMSSAIDSLRSPCPIYERNSASSESRGSSTRVRASEDDQSNDQDQSSLFSTTPPPTSPMSARRAAEKAEAEKGQRTAIVTGVISVMLGVGYLILTQLLDTRGVNLIPPPPEAFNP